jgi:hypothetical protein
MYEGVSKSFRTGRLERELQMLQLSATRCNCIAILWVSLVTFAVINLCVASQRVIPNVSVYLFRYRLSPETFGYSLIIMPCVLSHASFLYEASSANFSAQFCVTWLYFLHPEVSTSWGSKIGEGHDSDTKRTPVHFTHIRSGAFRSTARVRRCIQKFPDWIDNEINNNKHSLRSNKKCYSGKTH